MPASETLGPGATQCPFDQRPWRKIFEYLFLLQKIRSSSSSVLNIVINPSATFLEHVGAGGGSPLRQAGSAPAMPLPGREDWRKLPQALRQPGESRSPRASQPRRPAPRLPDSLCGPKYRRHADATADPAAHRTRILGCHPSQAPIHDANSRSRFPLRP